MDKTDKTETTTATDPEWEKKAAPIRGRFAELEAKLKAKERADPNRDGDGTAPPPERPGKAEPGKEKKGKGEPEGPTSEDYSFIRAHFAYSQSSDEFFFFHDEEVWGQVTEERVNLILTEASRSELKSESPIPRVK
jgi:hypothetical protein